MIRPFGLRDMWAVRQLQRHGTWLDLYHQLIHRRSPLFTALISPVPWYGTGLASFVWQGPRGVQGFIQMLRRPGRPEADIQFAAPGADKDQNAPELWQTLLTHCLESAGQHGVRRLYATLPEGTAEIDILARLGFTIYSNETIYVLGRPPRAAAAAQIAVRPQHADDSWWLRRLYSLYTPSPVQQAEGMGEKEELTVIPLAWWELSQQQCYVFPGGNGVQGCVQLVSGRRGHWIFLHGDPGNQQLMRALLQHGLHLLAGSRWPIYCAVRDYQGGLSAVLQDDGFEPAARRSRLVKHMRVRVKAAEHATVPSLAVEHSP